MFLKLTKLAIAGADEKVFEIDIDQTIEITTLPRNGDGYAGTTTFDIQIPRHDGSFIEASVLFKVVFDLVNFTGAVTAELLERGTALHLPRYRVIDHVSSGKESDYRELCMKRCEFCSYKQNQDGGWCYMFKDFMENCGVFVPV